MTKPVFYMSVLEKISEIPYTLAVKDRYFCGFTWREDSLSSSPTLQSLEYIVDHMMPPHLCNRETYRNGRVRLGAANDYMSSGLGNFIVCGHYRTTNENGETNDIPVGFAVGELTRLGSETHVYIEVLCSMPTKTPYTKHSGLRILNKTIEYAQAHGATKITLTAIPDALPYYYKETFGPNKQAFEHRKSCQAQPDVVRPVLKNDEAKKQHLKYLLQHKFGSMQDGFPMTLCLPKARLQNRYAKLRAKHLSDPDSPVYKAIAAAKASTRRKPLVSGFASVQKPFSSS